MQTTAQTQGADHLSGEHVRDIFRQFLEEGFENPDDAVGECQWVFTHGDEQWPLLIRYAPETLSFSTEASARPAAQVTMPLATAERLIETMQPDFLPGFFSLHDYTEPQIWLGSVPTDIPASTLHRDPLDGLLYQFIGRKRLLLFAPDQADKLYPMRAWNNYQPCWVQPDRPDYERFPKFRQAKGMEVILEPGELLVQPAGWFHEVSCLDSPTFSVSYFRRH